MSGIPIPYESREEWLELRRAGIGASDVAGILGLSPWATPFTVWAAKTRGYENDQTESMYWGLTIEDLVLDEFEQREGLKAGMRQTLFRHSTDDWALCTIDAIAFESPVDDDDVEDESMLGVVEAKTDGSFGAWSAIPDHYEIAAQWQMFVTGLDQGWMAVLHGGRRFEVYPFKADPKVQQLARDRVKVFREKYLLDPDAEPPEVDAHPATSKVIADLWAADPDESEIDLSAQMYADVEALAGWKREQKRINALVKEMENRVRVGMQEATVGRWGGVPVVTLKQQTVREHVRKESTFRVLRLVDAKE